MRPTRLEVHNFLSYRHVVFTFPKKNGVIQIKGSIKETGGSNGACKSGFYDAYIFAITGRTVRKSTEDTLVNNKAKKDLLVILDLDNGIRIIRGKKPSKLELWVDGEQRTQENMNATQELINTLLGIDYKTLVASCVLEKRNVVNFISASPEDKRKILRTFIDLEDIFTLRDKTKRLKSETRTQIKSYQAVIDEYGENIKIRERKLEELASLKEDFLGENKYSKEILDNLNIEEILEKEDKVRKLKENISKLKEDKENILKEQNAYLESLKETECSKCGAKVKPKQNVNLSGAALFEFASEYNYADLAIESDEYALSKIEIPFPSSDYKIYQEYKELVAQEEDHHRYFADAELKISDLRKKIAVLDAEYEGLIFWESAFSENGIIKFIIDNILDYFNSQCNYYLSYFSEGELTVRFENNLSVNIFKNGYPVSHNTISAGQENKINLAVSLALNSLLILRGKVEPQVLFLDEIADSLDNIGINGLWNLIKSLRKDKLIYVITHNPIFKGLLADEPVLQVVMEKDESRILS